MPSIKSIAQSVITVVVALAVIHFVAPASVKQYLGVS